MLFDESSTFRVTSTLRIEPLDACYVTLFSYVMTDITATELNRALGAILERAAAGETFRVLRKGEPIATIAPPSYVTGSPRSVPPTSRLNQAAVDRILRDAFSSPKRR